MNYSRSLRNRVFSCHMQLSLCYRWSTFGHRLFSVGADDIESNARWYTRPVTQCRWLPANVKDCVVHQILVYSARLRHCMKSHYINLLLTLTCYLEILRRCVWLVVCSTFAAVRPSPVEPRCTDDEWWTCWVEMRLRRRQRQPCQRQTTAVTGRLARV